ncbi:hypothetical protein M8494_10370 [Serratia ureilytica]
MPGVSDVQVWGPAGQHAALAGSDLIAARGLTAGDVIAAVREQTFRWRPVPSVQAPDSSTAFQVTVNTLGRLADEKRFGDIIIRTGSGRVTPARRRP